MGRPDLSNLKSEMSVANRAARALWGLVYLFLFRPSPRIAHGWRRFLLSAFGARIGKGVRVYPSARIWGPWNLALGDYSVLGDRVDCYCVAPIVIGAHAVVSQYSYLCAASHDEKDPGFALRTAPIRIGEGAWVAADVFVGPGVTIGEGAVVGARSSVFKDVEPWVVAVGTPARMIRKREMNAPASP